VTVKKHATAQVEENPKPLEPGMRRVLRVVTVLIPVATLAACVSPTAPSEEPAPCVAGKVPYATCANKDFINPLGDFINPLGDFINPLGNVSIRPGE
jgi:hypothetical protein